MNDRKFVSARAPLGVKPETGRGCARFLNDLGSREAFCQNKQPTTSWESEQRLRKLDVAL